MKQTINVGTTPNDNTGDTLRAAMIKVNDNFTELYKGAMGQAVALNSTFTATTTPQALAAYNNTNTFQQDTVVIQTLVAGDYTASMSPATSAYSGIYNVMFNGAASSPDNNIITFELYRNGVATGIKTILNISNASVDSGTIAMSGIHATTLTETDSLEIYIYASATSVITFDSVIFNIVKLGNL